MILIRVLYRSGLIDVVACLTPFDLDGMVKAGHRSTAAQAKSKRGSQRSCPPEKMQEGFQ